MKWVIAILIFSILILVHEFGHFLIAKLNGVEVREFSVGFGPRLVSTRWKGTRYSLKLLLFGGSCRMKSRLEDYNGEDDASVPDIPEEGSFESVSPGRRASILFAGPFFNFLLAFVCAVVVIGVVGYDPAEIVSVDAGSAADEAGLKEGDIITSFMGTPVDIGRDVSTWFVMHTLQADDTVTMTYTRDGESHSVSFSPDVITRYMMGFSYNADDSQAVIGSVSEGSPLDQAGVQAGDIITEINGQPVAEAADLNEYIKAHPLDGSPVYLVLKRDGVSFEKTITPVASESISLGLSYNLGRVKTDAPGVLRYSLIELRYWIGTTVQSLGGMFTGRFGVNDLSGPVGVVDIVGTTYEETKSQGALMTWMNMLNLIILLSANLGVMNLLPIPGLDGGRIVSVLFEAVRGKPVNWKIESTVTMIAAALLVALMIYVMYHDITSLFMR